MVLFLRYTYICVYYYHNMQPYIIYITYIYTIDHNLNWKENQRQKRESFWIRELQTLHPEGINKKA